MKKYILCVIFFPHLLFSSEFMLYADNNDIPAIQKLIQNGYNINEIDATGCTALHIAAWNGYTDLTRYLLEMGANPNIATQSGNTPLTFATPSSYDLLLQYGALKKTEIKEIAPLYYSRTVYVENPCQQSSHSCHSHSSCTSPVFVQPIPEKPTRPKICARCSQQKKSPVPLPDSPSHNYPQDSYKALSKITAEESISLHSWDNEGKNSIHRAASGGDLEGIKQLVAIGVNPLSKNINGDTALRFAAEFNHLETAKYLVESLGLDVNSTNNEGTTPLLVATVHNNLSLIRYLIKMGANVNSQTTAYVQRKINGEMTTSMVEGWTPLMAASQSGFNGAIDMLTNARASINATDSDNWTALMYAVQNGYGDTVKKLLELGINYNIESKDKHTALSIARDDNDIKIMAILESMGARESTVPVVSLDTEDIEVTENVAVEGYEYYTEEEGTENKPNDSGYDSAYDDGYKESSYDDEYSEDSYGDKEESYSYNY